MVEIIVEELKKNNKYYCVYENKCLIFIFFESYYVYKRMI